jgi:prepilin-type N-terminal cleavage/methylation domain-containing protein
MAAPGPRIRGRAGVTLVELMVTMALALIVSGVAFMIYRINTSFYLREEAYIQQQQNLRAAFYIMGRDLRMAGNGMKVIGPDVRRVRLWTSSRQILSPGGFPAIDPAEGWFAPPDDATPGAWAIFGLDGGADRPDTVTVFRSEVEYPSQLGVISSVSGNSYRLSQDVPEGALECDAASGKCDVVALVNGDQAVIVEVEEFDDDLVTVRLGEASTPPSLPASFPLIGAAMYSLRGASLTTFYLDEASDQLMAAYHDRHSSIYDDPATRSMVVANNIEDLQVYFFYDGFDVDPESLRLDPDLGSGPLADREVKAVALGLTSRSGYGEGPNVRTRPALYNREAGTATDNRRRTTLSEFIYLRNHAR